jgi:hypothetical protein
MMTLAGVRKRIPCCWLQPVRSKGGDYARRQTVRDPAVKTLLLGVAALAFVGVSPASATTASQREYKRGYADCAAGRYDQDRHGASYKKGCRAAEDKAAKKAKACPPDISEADRYKYPGCK